MANHSIWVLEYGYVDRFPLSNLLSAQPNEGHRRMPYCFGLVRSPERCVLVDTGFYEPASQERITARYGENYWRSPAEVLWRLGIPADAVDTVLLTHNHFDHAGCVGSFPQAHVYIQRREIERYLEAIALPRRFEFLTRACQPDLPELLAVRAREGKVTYADGDMTPLPGIDLRPAYDTHTAGSQFVVVENTADGRWLFAGDNAYVYENIEGLRGDGVLEPIGTSTGSQSVWLAAIDQALSWVGQDCGRVLPFHDSRLWDRFPSRLYDDGLHVAEISLAGGHESLLAGDSDQHERRKHA